MNATTKERVNSKYIVKLTLGLIIIFVLGNAVPTWGPVTRTGVQAICMFFGLIYMLSNSEFGLILPALLGFTALVMTDAFDPPALIAATFGNTVVAQIIFAYVCCQLIISTGAAEFISKWLLARKNLEGRPHLFTFVFFIAAWIMGAFAHIGGIVFNFTLLDSLLVTIDEEEEGKLARWLSLGTFISAAIGMGLIPFQGLPLVIFGSIMTAMSKNGITLNYGTYMLSVIVFSILLILAFNFAIKASKVDISKLRSFDPKSINSNGESLKATSSQVIAIIIFFFGISYSILGAFIPKGTALGKIFETFDQCTWFILALSIFFMLRQEGKPILNAEKTFRSGISWSIVLTVCVFNVIGGMMANPAFGVRIWLNQILAPIFTGMPFPIFILVICLVGTLCTNFFANAAVGLIIGTLTMPFAIAYSKTIGINVTVYGACVTMSAMFAFLTLASSGYAPLLLTRPCIQKHQNFIWGIGSATLIIGALLMAIVFTVLAYIL